jgi:hypothetical protein
MESKGWVEGDCEYTITCKCELELVEWMNKKYVSQLIFLFTFVGLASIRHHLVIN